MKKKFVGLMVVFLAITSILGACGSKADSKGTMEVLTLNEVAHSIFYAPLYVAMEEGYFAEEGIDLKLVTGFGADKTMTALISGDAQIGYMGPEASIYAYLEGANDPVVNFAQGTQRAGNFLVARKSDFQWDDLKGKVILGGRAGGMPEMVFEYILKKKGINPKTDVMIDQSIDFGSTAAAFSGGKGDFTVEFEPAATALEKEQAGTVVASCGVESGFVPYTAFGAKKSYIQTHPETIQRFVMAVQKGMDYVNSHDASAIAKIIAPQFKEQDSDTLTTIVQRYQEQKTWKEDLVFEKESFELLQDILESAGELKERVEYSELVDTEFAQNAKKE